MGTSHLSVYENLLLPNMFKVEEKKFRFWNMIETDYLDEEWVSWKMYGKYKDNK